jgi:hypothetical protein
MHVTSQITTHANRLMNGPSLRTASLAVGAVLLTLGLAACDQSVLAPEASSPADAAARTDVLILCEPTLTGPSTSSPGTTSTFSFYHKDTCALQSINWSVTYDATITSISQISRTPVGYTSGGSATVLAGQCNYTVTAQVNFGSGTLNISKPVSLNYDCHAPQFYVHLNSVSAGIGVTWTNVGASYYEVHRQVIPASTGIPGPWQHLGNTTGHSWTDTQYQT